MKLPPRVTVYEVGPRDGLQNEARHVPTAEKIAFITALIDSGLSRIEITSFVSPKWIPQLADAAEVARGVPRKEGVVLSCLVPNRRGLDTALAAGMREVAVFMSASETHNKKNVNKTMRETLAAFADVVPPALAAGVPVRAYLSTCFGCPTRATSIPRWWSSCAASCGRWASTRSRCPTRSASPTRRRSRTCSAGC
jgi:hydroxymethylglutaryl-CoA lyase